MPTDVEDVIQFVAKDGKKVVVKKIKPGEHHPIDVAFFLAGLLDTIYNWTEHYLSQAIDVSKIDSVVEEITRGKRASKNAVGEIVAAVNGPKVSKVINEIVEPLAETYQKKELEAIKTLLKAYALRKAFMKLNLKVDYSLASEQLRKGLKKYARGK